MKNYIDRFLDPMLSGLGGVVPSVVGAIIVLIVGFLIAKAIKSVLKTILSKSRLDERINKRTKSGNFNIENTISNIVYYLILVYVLLLVLDMMGVRGVLAPLQGMFNEFIQFIPRILAAGIIGFAGYIIASIAKEAAGLLTGGLDKLSAKIGVKSSFDFTKVVRQIVFLIVFIPILIIALDSLKMEVISGPATEALSTLLGAIPNIIAAAIILALFFIGGRYISKIIESLAANLGIDQMANKVEGIQYISQKTAISKIIGNLVFFFIAFSGTIAAIEKLQFMQLSAILSELLELCGHIFFGLIILGVGTWIASIAYKMLSKNQENKFVASIARAGIIGLFLAIGLRQMGIADEIVNLAFGLTLGAIAVAIALSFGIGGREAAGKLMNDWVEKYRNSKGGNNEGPKKLH